MADKYGLFLQSAQFSIPKDKAFQSYLELNFLFHILWTWFERFNSFMTEVPYYIETSPLISSANQWTGFSMVGASVLKELKLLNH